MVPASSPGTLMIGSARGSSRVSLAGLFRRHYLLQRAVSGSRIVLVRARARGVQVCLLLAAIGLPQVVQPQDAMSVGHLTTGPGSALSGGEGRLYQLLQQLGQSQQYLLQLEGELLIRTVAATVRVLEVEHGEAGQGVD